MSKSMSAACLLSASLHAAVLLACPIMLSAQRGEQGTTPAIVVHGIVQLSPVPVELEAPPVKEEPPVEESVVATEPEEKIEKKIPEAAPVLVPPEQEKDIGGEKISAGREADLRTRYLMSVMRRLEQKKRYPVLAYRRGIEGIVTVDLTIMADGTVRSVKVVRTSSESILDREVVALARRVSPLGPIPEQLGLKEIRLSVPVEFRIEDRF